LETVLPAEKLAPFRAHTFPRFVSSKMENLLLHSEGPLEVHTKENGEKVYFRNGENPDVKLVWSVPPQKIDSLKGNETKACFAVDSEYQGEVKAIVSKLQRLEWLVLNAKVPEKYSEYQARLVERIRDCYQAFSVIVPELKAPKVSGWLGSYYSLFSIPKNKEQAYLKENMEYAKSLINALYIAVVDGAEIDDLLPPEPAVIVLKDEDDSNNLTTPENSLEALAAYLPEETQKKLCRIIGRNYCEREEALTLS
jgi:hypothetical protein